MLRGRGAIGVSIVVLSLSGCDTLPTEFRPSPEPRYDPPTFALDESVFTDTQLRAATFSTYQAPPGFYWENQNQSTAYYMNTWSIHAGPLRDPAHRIELSTEDPQEARMWADSTYAYSNETAPFDTAGPVVTDRYFEFEPVAGAGIRGVRLRAHRAGYLDRSTEGRQGTDWLYGTFQVRPIDAVTVRGLAEYIWFLNNNYSRASKPLTSFSRTLQPYDVVHVVYSADHVRTDTGPDMIALYRDDCHVYAFSGTVVVHSELVRSIRAFP